MLDSVVKLLNIALLFGDNEMNTLKHRVLLLEHIQTYRALLSLSVCLSVCLSVVTHLTPLQEEVRGDGAVPARDVPWPPPGSHPHQAEPFHPNIPQVSWLHLRHQRPSQVPAAHRHHRGLGPLLRVSRRGTRLLYWSLSQVSVSHHHRKSDRWKSWRL